MTTGQHKTLVPLPYRNAVVVITIAIGMAAIFATSYSLVLGRATPHRITIGLVGSPAKQPALLAALKRATHGGLAFHPYAADAAAVEAIDDQAIYAALVLDQGIPGVEICTRESRLDRRTSCLQSNVEFLQQVVSRNALDAQQKLSAASREIAALKEQLAAANRDLAALRDALSAIEAKIARPQNESLPAGPQTPQAKQPGK